MSKDVLENSELEMTEEVDTVKRRLGKLRTGKASPALLDGVMVEYYGSPTPLKQLATVSAPEPRQLTVKPFDRSSMTRWRQRVGADALEVLLAETIAVAVKTEAATPEASVVSTAGEK